MAIEVAPATIDRFDDGGASPTGTDIGLCGRR